MPNAISTMVDRVHRAREQVEEEVIGPARDQLRAVFEQAEVELGRRARIVTRLETDPSTGALLKTADNINAAQDILDELQGEIDRVLIEPGKDWADDAVAAAHKAGRNMARVNLDVGRISPELLQAAFDNVTIAQGDLMVGFDDTYKIINTVGNDVGEWFRRETMDAIAEGLPVVSKTGGDSLMARLIESGRLKPITIKTESGRLIRRSVSQRAEAIARLEMNRIVNRTHETLAREALGNEAVFKNSNPRDSRTTDICRRASRQAPMTLEQWSASEFKRPPRLRPFHLCRSFLIGGEAEWFDDLEEEKPEKPADLPIEKRLQLYEAGDRKVRRIQQWDRARQGRIERLTEKINTVDAQVDDLVARRAAPNIPDDEFADLTRQVYAIQRDIPELMEQRTALRRRSHERLFKILGGKNEALRPKYRVRGPSRVRAERATEFVGGLLRYDGEINFDIKHGRGKRFRDTAYRGIHQSPRVEMNTKSPTKIHVHEQGHIVQYTVPGVQKRLDEFIRYRIKPGEKPVRFNEKWPKSNYGDDEIGYRDDLLKAFNGDEHSAYYAGKVYASGKSRELLSQGLQLLYDDPVGFATRDPEYCKFILGLMDGGIR